MNRLTTGLALAVVLLAAATVGSEGEPIRFQAPMQTEFQLYPGNPGFDSVCSEASGKCPEVVSLRQFIRTLEARIAELERRPEPQCPEPLDSPTLTLPLSPAACAMLCGC